MVQELSGLVEVTDNEAKCALFLPLPVLPERASLQAGLRMSSLRIFLCLHDPNSIFTVLCVVSRQ